MAGMADPNEIDALKASLRGALTAADTLRSLQTRVEAIDAHTGISPEDLEELGRVTLAHAVAAQALRGLVETMRNRQANV
jgi:hypothetical protein